MANLIDDLSGIGFGGSVLPPNDDASSDFIDVSAIFETGLNFFGEQYNGFYVNNNGGVTFERGRTAFTPSAITDASEPGLFPYFADVDTRGGSATPTLGGTSQGTNRVHVGLDEAGDRVVITWDDVGYYNRETDKLNAFQLVIEDASDEAGRADGDFDFSFRYEAIEWTTGSASGGVDGLGGAPARAGWAAGNGVQFFELPASGDVAALLALPTSEGNVGVDGVWQFEVRNGGIPNLVFVEPSAFPRRASEGDAGTSTLTFVLKRTGDLSEPVSVDWSIAASGPDGADGSDFVGGALPSGTGTFAAGQDTLTLEIAIAGDVALEDDEKFSLSLDSVTGSTTFIAGDQASAMIENDDEPNAILIEDATGEEPDTGTAAMSFTVRRTGDLTGPASVDYEVIAPGGSVTLVGAQERFLGAELFAEANDFAGPLSGTVAFAPGEAETTVELLLASDAVAENPESFTVVLSNATGGAELADPVARGTIVEGAPPPPPPAGALEANLFGLSHLVTFDGLAYDFSAAGQYVLAETVEGARDPFQIQARFRDDLEVSELFSTPTTVAVDIGGTTVEASRSGVRTDAGRLELPGGTGDVDGDGTDDVFFDGEAYTLVLDGGDQLKVDADSGLFSVLLAADRAGAVRGLLGEADGNPGDDLGLRDGTVPPDPVDYATLYGAFADSWATDAPGDTLTGKASLFSFNVSRSTPATSVTLADLPPALVARAEAIVDEFAISNEPLRQAAILDVALTGRSTSAQAAAQVDTPPTVRFEPADPPPLGEAFGVFSSPMSFEVFDDGSATTVDFTVYRLGDLSGSSSVQAFASREVFGTFDSFTVDFAPGQSATTISVPLSAAFVSQGDVSTEEFSFILQSAPTFARKVARVTAVNEGNRPPVAREDNFAVAADSVLTGNLFADNGAGQDFDREGDPFAVSSAGSSASFEGADYTVNADGSFTYDPRERFDELPLGETETDVFFYEITGGDEVPVTITVTGTFVPGPGATTEDQRIVGTAADETLRGSFGDDTMLGFPGDDSLNGAAGDDYIRGDRGDDTLFGAQGDDNLFGGRGEDIIGGGSGNNILHGGFGDDEITGGNEADTLIGGRGNDSLLGLAGADVIRGRADNDTIEGGGGNDFAAGHRGDDLLFGGTGNDTLDGGEGEDLLFGGDQADLVIGADGDDFLSGGGGRDTLRGNAGDDTLWGGDGDDLILGHEGDTVDNDTAFFEGPVENYTIILVNGRINRVDVVDEVGAGGTDTVLRVERFDFAGTVFDVADLPFA